MSITSAQRFRWTIAFMAAGALVLLAVVVTSIWLAVRARENVEVLAQARTMRAATSDIMESLLDAETGQRGFVLTQDRAYLTPYEQAVKTLPAQLEALRTLTARDPQFAQRLDALSQQTEAKLAELAVTVDLTKAGQRQRALRVVDTGAGKQTMDDLRGIVGNMRRIADERVAVRIARSRADADLLTLVSVLGGGVIMVFGLAAMWSVVQNIAGLNNARTEVEALNRGLEDRVAERTAALTRANDEIQRFAYIVSHDLRAPLVNIMGFTAELETGAAALRKFMQADQRDALTAETALRAANEDLPEAVRFIRASTGRMDKLINAILKLSREGQRELRVTQIDLAEFLKVICASLRHQFDEASAEVTIDANVTMVTDRLALEQIVGNLLDNALKYRAPDRPLRLALQAKAQAGRVLIRIADNGRGIAAADLARVFELFRRAGRQDQIGEGVGLTFVRALVRRMDGDITVESGLGRGTTFLVDLPLWLASMDAGHASAKGELE